MLRIHGLVFVMRKDYDYMGLLSPVNFLNESLIRHLTDFSVSSKEKIRCCFS